MASARYVRAAMPSHIFFSWQLDRPTRTGRNLVQRALELAIRAIEADAEVNLADRLEVDRDTINVAGLPPLVDVIFGKVDGATVFMSDMTYVAERADGRRMPNPNVLIEHGYAMKSRGWPAIISVMNVAHGHPDAHPLPFDLQHYRRPIFFDCPDGADDNARRTARDRLSGQLVTALRAILTDQAARAAGEPERPAKPHPHDVELLERFRTLVTPGHQRFLLTQSFGAPFRRDKLNPFYEIAEDWVGATFQFHDAALEARFAEVRSAIDALTDLTAFWLYPMDGPGNLLTPKTGHDQSHGLQPATREAIAAMDQAASTLAEAITSFERAARDRIRVGSSTGGDAAARRQMSVQTATGVITELDADRVKGGLFGLATRPSMTLRAVLLAALDRPRLDAGQVTQAPLLFPPDSDTRVETGSDGRQWWNIEPPRNVGRPNPESAWRTRLVRPGAIEFEATVGARIDDDPEIAIKGRALERRIVAAFERMGAALAVLDLTGPALVSLMFDGTEDVILTRARPGGRKIRQPFFAIPLFLVNDLTGPIGDDLHEAFDIPWQTAGWPDGSPSFGTGQWQADRA
jgi:hypothetical protein